VADVRRLPPPPAKGELQLWLLPLDQPPWPGETLSALLDDEERARAARFHFEIHRRRFAHGRGMLRLLLSHCTGTAPAQLRFVHGPQGKPALRPACPAAPEPAPPSQAPLNRPSTSDALGAGPLAFNLSHSGEWALLGLSAAGEVGVDIELPREVPELESIARANFAPREFEGLMALPAPARGDGFLAGWTRKEAFVKALAGGLSIPLSSFEVTLAPGLPPRLLHVAAPAPAATEFTLWAGRTPQEGWVAAVVRSARASVRTFSLPQGTPP